MNDSFVEEGKSYPLGARVYKDGVNFSIFSKGSTALELLLFDNVNDSRPARIISMDHDLNRTSFYRHAFIPGIKAGQVYGYRAHGPYKPEQGLRFDSEKVLLDPYGKAVAVPDNYSHAAACKPGDNTATAMKNVVADLNTYNWDGDMPLRRPFSKTVIYEMHVAGFTGNPNSGVADGKRGTYAGLIEKIPYLKDLGITAVELMPVFQFDEQDCPSGLINYWGYSPVSFFAPHAAYSSRKDILGPLDEFRDMVKALHRAGIEVILDVVYNHTAEGNHEGPTICFRGLANSTYYILENDKAHYTNYTGCGNTLNANLSIVRRLIIDSLHFWVKQMHVDGFRFDLASILSRDVSGRPLENPPVLWDIDSDPVLAGTKLIAEAWDAAGLYQVGSFIGYKWKEWNGRFRDDIRGFLKGDGGTVSKLAPRLLASPDIFGHEEREPDRSINFVTCHDGFTLNDLVSYDRKHNEANGEGNRDGSDNNLSWNCGCEGPVDDPVIEQLRKRQIKNFFAINFLSLGVPMILMGDEVRRTQQGNNNAYCQNNEAGWFDWTLVEKNEDIRRFVKCLLQARLNQREARPDLHLSLNELLRKAYIKWHGVKQNKPDWSYDSHSLAVTALVDNFFIFHLMLNSYKEPLEFELPSSLNYKEHPWHCWIDTYRESPEDIFQWDEAPEISGSTYLVQPHSIAVLFHRISYGTEERK